MTKKNLTMTLSAALFVAFTMTACNSASDDDTIVGDPDAVGSLELSLTNVPGEASCLEVSIAGSRSVSKNFDLTPGTSPRLTVSGLPAGVVKVDAKAFSSKCSKVKTGDTPTFVLEKPVTARIDAQQVAKILLKLIYNGQGELVVDFEAPPWFSNSKKPLDLAVIGDTPYGAAQIEDFPKLLADIAADERVSAVLHLGDIKNGSSRCDDSYFAQILADFLSLPIPLIYTPGDNEWTDCHRANNGAYDPLERLDVLREVFFSVPGLASGGGFMQVAAQSDDPGFSTFVENQLWFDASVAFAAVHVVGSNDSKVPWYTDDKTGTKVDDPARRDAERNARNAASLAWIDRAFDTAELNDAAGVVIMMQADMFDAYSVANNIPLDAFSNIVQKLGDRSKEFGKPVLLLEGDSHGFLVDRPLENGNAVHGVTSAVPNLTRLVVQGSTTKPKTEWLRLHVDPGDAAVFTWERNAR